MNTKKILFALFCTVFVFQSCDSDDYQPKEVEFRIDYSFSSGSMSRATNDEIYTKFYEDHIKTRKITPENYALLFTNKETGQKNEIRGLWSENNLIRLTEGTYTVTGNSYDGPEMYAKDKVVLSFNTEFTVRATTESMVVTASYNCPLLFFSESLISGVRYKSGYINGYSEVIDKLSTLDNYYYCFVKEFYTNANSYFEITRTNGRVSKVYTDNLNLENGKYYFFNDMTGGFDLEPMTPGN